MMNEAIELHDSKITAIDCRGARVAMRFQPAYVHRSQGVLFQDAGEGGWRNFEWEFEDAVTQGELALPAWIIDGRLECGDTVYENIIPLPLTFRGRVVLSLVTNNGENWGVRGKGICIAPLNEGRFCDVFP